MKLFILALCICSSTIVAVSQTTTPVANPISLATPVATPSPSPAPQNLQPTSTATAAVPVAAAKGAVVLPPEKAAPVTIPKFAQAPMIDGILNEPVWQNAAKLKDFYQIDPGDNTQPSKPTEVLLGYDSKFLYIAFRAFDEPDKVRSTVAKRDSIFSDDCPRVHR